MSIRYDIRQSFSKTGITRIKEKRVILIPSNKRNNNLKKGFAFSTSSVQYKL